MDYSDNNLPTDQAGYSGTCSDGGNMTIMEHDNNAMGRQMGGDMKSTQLGPIREQGLVDAGLRPNNGEWSEDWAGE
jgi:hypothetical protein